TENKEHIAYRVVKSWSGASITGRSGEPWTVRQIGGRAFPGPRPPWVYVYTRRTSLCASYLSYPDLILTVCAERPARFASRLDKHALLLKYISLCVSPTAVFSCLSV